MWDQLIALLDEIFSTCYTWIPQSITNEFTCGGTISIPNCPDVGISNPLEVLIYWGYRLFGNAWCDFMIGVTSWLSFLLDDTVRTCAAIQTASPSQMDRQLYCGIISIGTLSLVLLGGFIIGTFIIAVVLALINVLHALLLLLPFLPFYDRLIGTFQKEDEPQEVDGIQFVKKKQPGLVDYMAKGIKLAFLTKSREIE
jgi:sterol desaturase/sphingolipid hydroxylase (fatty acid hydroxylase superfamily)